MKKLYISTLVACGFTLCSPASDLVWRPSSAVWDAVQVNWIHNISALGTAFTPGDNVIFDDGGNAFTQVKLVAGISAGTVLVDAIGDYTFTTNVVGGGISSLTSLTKRGSGKLIIDTDNGFSGPTTIEGGVLQIGNGIARGTLGSSSITNNAGLVVSRTGILNLTNTLGGGGWLTNALAGTLQISGVNNMAGIISVNAGTLLLSNAPAAGSPTDVLINATVGTAGTRLLLAGGVTYPVGTTIRCLGTSSAANMRCNLLGNPGFNSLNGPIFCSGDGLVQVNGSGVGEFTVASSINANPADAVQFNGQLFLRGTGVGKLTGQVTLPGAFVNKTDAGSWTISSTGNSWSSTSLAVGLLRVGADNALPTTVALQMGQSVVNSALDLGGFNEALYPNEENALMDELQKKGGILLYDPQFAVHRRPRPSLRAFMKMLMTYGRGRAEQFRLHPTPGSILNFVPPLFCIYLLMLFLTPWAGLWLLAPLGLYAMAVLGQTLAMCSSGGVARSLGALPLIVVTHIFYGIGFWRGLFTELKAPGKSEVPVELEHPPVKGE